MKTPEKLKNWVKEFISKHYYDVNWEECNYNDKTYDDVMKEIDNEPDIMVGWILMEVMSWSMKDGEDWNEKLSLIQDNEDDRYIIKLDNHFYAVDEKEHFLMIEVFPKYKQVMYFSNEE